MSKKIVILFPGQGSQYVGMGNELQDQSILDFANTALDYDLKKVMLDGPLEELTLTSNTQPAILTYSWALWKKVEALLKKKEKTPYAILGHSVGEYTALAAAGSFTFQDALGAVHARGKFMQDAIPAGVGTMYAILKVPMATINKVCQEVTTQTNIVSAANYNEPNQIVISGHIDACQKAVELLKSKHQDPFRAIELKVSAPFHCSLMKPSANQMQKVLNQLQILPNKVPYIANIDAMLYPSNTNVVKIKENLIQQIEGSVLWTQSIKSLPEDVLYVEVGPGKILSGLVKKINKSLSRETEILNLNQSLNFELLAERL